MLCCKFGEVGSFDSTCTVLGVKSLGCVHSRAVIFLFSQTHLL